MGIIDKVGALLPGGASTGSRRLAPMSRRCATDWDRWFERFFEEPWGALAPGELRWTPSAELHETGNEVAVTVEIPGLDRDDLNLMITPRGLIIRGEGHHE